MKERFIDNEIWILTFGGGFQRANIYQKEVADSAKSEFRNSLKNEIKRLVESHYSKNECSPQKHLENIVYLSDWTAKHFNGILKGGKINIGVSQKLLNLYLKYQWCLNKIPRPPHCPLDRIVISQFEKTNPTPWTKIDEIGEYERLISEAKIKASDQSLADWELAIFNRRNENNKLR